jgi:CBS-domain-containing membrane protein
MRKVTVADIMTRDIVAIDQDKPYKEIVEILISEGVSALPVVDAQGRVIGVVSEADLLHKEEHADQTQGDSPPMFASSRTRQAWDKSSGRVAKDLMSSPVRTVRVDTPISKAARWLARSEVRRLFVVEGERVVGVMSRRDLLRAFLREDHDIRAEIENEVFGRVLWAEPGEVDIDVKNGVVSLDAAFETAVEHDIAVGLINQIPGVVAVDSAVQ